MAAQLALSNAVVTRPNGDQVTDIMAIVRGNVLKLCGRTRYGDVEEIAGVTAVETVRRDRQWTVRMDNGDVYDVKNAGKQNCSTCA